jgi:hypothetical protein
VRVAIVLAGLFVASTASADEVFLRVGVGAGRFRARQPEAGDTVLGSIAQTGYSGELSVGASIRRFTIAATLLEHIVTFKDDGWRPTHPLAGDATSLTLATLGPSVEYHPRVRGGPFVGGMIGIASFSNRSDDRPLGFGLAMHGGYDIPTGDADRSAIGFALRLYYASMGSDQYGRTQVFSPMLMVQYVYR